MLIIYSTIRFYLSSRVYRGLLLFVFLFKAHYQINNINQVNRITENIKNKSPAMDGEEKNRQDIASKSYDYDEILIHLGQMGRSQLRSFLWLCIPAMFAGVAVMTYIFTGEVPNYR